MDLSKLPRLSETGRQAPPPQQAAESTPAVPWSRTGAGAEVWLSVVLGLVFMMMGWNFARWSTAKLTGRPFHTGVDWTTGERAGQEVEYFDLQGYTAYTETGIFLFGLVMVMEGCILALVTRNTPLSRVAVTLTLVFIIGMTTFNLIVAGLLFKIGLMPLTSILAVAFGGWMAMKQWEMLKQMLGTPSA